MTTTPEQERAAFECEMTKLFGEGEDFSRDGEGCYINRSWHDAWIGWQARAALAQAAPVQQAGHSNCSECPSGTLTRDDVDVMSLNSARFRWLTEDHADPITRAKVAEILGRMSVMSHSATCADIDIAIGEADDRAAAPKPGADHV